MEIQGLLKEVKLKLINKHTYINDLLENELESQLVSRLA